MLRSHLARIRISVLKAGPSPKKIREIAKQEAKGLLKIAQTGVRNTAGGSGEYEYSSTTVLVVIVPRCGLDSSNMSSIKGYAWADDEVGRVKVGVSSSHVLQY